MASESKKTVATAFLANVAIFVVKAFGGVLTGSASMLAEAAHSLADTANEVFLWVSLDLGAKRPDERHPFGYGRERFFWAFLAAVFIFAAGGVFAIARGVLGLMSGSRHNESFVIAYAVLGAALVAEGISLTRAVRQTRREAVRAHRTWWSYIVVSQDPTVKTVVLEDSAAVTGLVIAFVAIALHQITGASWWDDLGSVLIGVLLCAVGFVLGRDVKGLLIGEPALPEQRAAIRGVLDGHDEIEHVHQLLTIVIGPESIVVAARVDLAERLVANEIEHLADDVEQEIRAAVPGLQEFFLDPTGALAVDK